MNTTEILNHLNEISEELKALKLDLAEKRNLYCPGCQTLKDILDRLSLITDRVAQARDENKIDRILEKLESIEWRMEK